MDNFNKEAVQKAAYYIWKNNGCPQNTGAKDWNSAINQLSAMAALQNASRKMAQMKATSAKNNLMQIGRAHV